MQISDNKYKVILVNSQMNKNNIQSLIIGMAVYMYHNKNQKVLMTSCGGQGQQLWQVLLVGSGAMFLLNLVTGTLQLCNKEFKRLEFFISIIFNVLWLVISMLYSYFVMSKFQVCLTYQMYFQLFQLLQVYNWSIVAGLFLLPLKFTSRVVSPSTNLAIAFVFLLLAKQMNICRPQYKYQLPYIIFVTQGMFSLTNGLLACCLGRKNKDLVNKALEFVQLLCEFTQTMVVLFLLIQHFKYPLTVSNQCSQSHIVEDSFISIQLIAIFYFFFFMLFRFLKNRHDKQNKHQQFQDQIEEEHSQQQIDNSQVSYYENHDHYGNKVQFGSMNIVK